MRGGHEPDNDRQGEKKRSTPMNAENTTFQTEKTVNFFG